MKILEDNIYLNMSATTKEEAIQLAGDKLLSAGYIEPAYIDGMQEREKVATTFLGMGFAIPHGVKDAKKFVKESGLVVLQFPQGVSFDGEDVFVVIGIAGVGDEHLEILSNIAVILDDELTDVLKATTDKGVFLEKLK